jgi:hypothetical protein
MKSFFRETNNAATMLTRVKDNLPAFQKKMPGYYARHYLILKKNVPLNAGHLPGSLSNSRCSFRTVLLPVIHNLSMNRINLIQCAAIKQPSIFHHFINGICIADIF